MWVGDWVLQGGLAGNREGGGVVSRDVQIELRRAESGITIK